MSKALTYPSTANLNLNDIPEAYRPQVTNFNQYLIDGELKTWNGNMAEVYSTIRTENEKGEMTPTLLGSVPDMESRTQPFRHWNQPKKLLTEEKDSGLPCVLENG